MNAVYWWLVDKLSRVLDPDEREAVRGDFAESHMSGGQAVRGLLGLIARRQLALWKNWQPWLALVGIVALAGPQLYRISFGFSDVLAMHIAIYWRYGIRYETGLTFPEDVTVFVCQAAALLLWSWTSGLALGILSRRTIWVQAAAVGLGWILLGDTLRMIRLGAMVPLVFQMVLLLGPAIWGARQGFRLNKLKLSHAIPLFAAVATVTALTTWTSGWWPAALETWSRGAIHPAVGWPTRLIPFAVVSWPVFYLLAAAGTQRHRTEAIEI